MPPSNPPSRYRSGIPRKLRTEIERTVSTEVTRIEGNAIVAATRTHGVRYTAHSALDAIEDLTDMEALALQRNPHGAARYRVIVDVATARLAQIVAETGQV
jgi:hypothetical protein